jgi:hypothetical protein
MPPDSDFKLMHEDAHLEEEGERIEYLEETCLLVGGLGDSACIGIFGSEFTMFGCKIDEY